MVLGLSDYEFKLNTTGVLLNDHNSTIPFVDIDKVVGLDSAPYRETIRDHEGTDGGFMDAEFEKGREIILEGTIFGTPGSLETYLDAIKSNYAPVTAPIPLYFKPDGVTERVIFVKPRGVRADWETARRIGAVRAQFMMYAEDPRIYTNDLITTVITYGGDAGIGLAFSFAFNVDFGGGAAPGGGTLTNAGNRPAPATLVIQGPIINPVITNNTLGKTISFTIELTASDTLTIDLANHTVYLNGNINRRNTMNSANWFLLAVGANQITFGGLSGTGSTLTATYRAAWR